MPFASVETYFGHVYMERAPHQTRVRFVVETSGGKQCDGKIFLSPGREATTFAAKGSGGALKLPQRVRAEPGRQTYFTAFGAIKLNLVMMIFNNLLLKNLK